MSTDSTSIGLAAMGRRAWRSLMPMGLRRAAQPLVRRILLGRIEAALREAGITAGPGPLIVSGLLSEAKGVSEGARLSLAAFRAAGLAPVPHDLRPLFVSGISRLPVSGDGGVWFVHVNAPEAIQALGRLPPDAWRGRYRIGYWAYELPRVPAEWVRASEAFNEIWVPSRFVAEALRASGVTVPVRLMPHPVALGSPPPAADRAAFGIDAAAFAVLTMGDLQSSGARKNLAGAIDIFRRAFPQPGEALLLVKLREASLHPATLDAIRSAAGERADIRFITENLSSDDMRRLLASSSVILSPHRAEGFGLPLAEALLVGVPALATGWSGNLDFMSDLPELLISSTLTPVVDPQGIYRGQEWAEPDVSDAVDKLRTLFASAELRTELAARGRAAVEALNQPWTREALMTLPLGQRVAAP